MYRQGDVLIEAAAFPTEGLTARESRVLAEGEATGHAHVVEGDVEMYEDAQGTLWCRVKEPAEVTHQEHGKIGLPRGEYKVTRQVQLNPAEEAVRVTD